MVRYLVAKNQKGGHVLYYWQPNKVLRRAGFLPRRLAERTNNLTDAISEAELLNAEVDVWRKGLEKPIAIQPSTLPWLIELYRSDERFLKLRPKTRQSYNENIKEILKWSERGGHPQLSKLTRKHVKDFYRSFVANTPSKANAVIRVLSILLAFAVDEGELKTNQASKMRLKGTPPRQTVWTDQQIEIACRASTDVGRSSIALAVMLAANLGQREGDILRIGWSQYDGDVIKLRQSKTGKLISVPVTTDLREALDKTERKSPNMVISETTGRPYKENNFRSIFAEIRKRVGLEEVLFMDLRRTAVVRLAEAGCEVHEISAITGHSLSRSASILEVYLPRNERMARNAIIKLEEHKRRTKLEV